MTNSSGQKVWSAELLPFGEGYDINEDVDGDQVNVINNLRFQGQYYDIETGYHYNVMRDYNPPIGRYTQSDPIGLAGGINTFSYAKNDPINHIDPNGLLFELIWSNASQRGNHRDEAITMSQFIKYANGKSLYEIQHAVDQGSKGPRSAGGPETSFRYVVNPNNPNEVLDMRHFLAVGPQGELAGLAIEVLQALGGDRASAFDAQDFLSNALGAKFFKRYNPELTLGDQLNKYFFGVIECQK